MVEAMHASGYLCGAAQIRELAAGSACARPSSGGRTSSSTPTPSGGSSGWPGSGRRTSSSRSVPGWVRSPWRCCRRSAHVIGRRGRPDARRGPAGHRRGAGAGVCRPAHRRHADALHRARAAGPASQPPWWPTCPTTSRCPSSWTSSRPSPPCSGCWSWCSSRWPSGSPPGRARKIYGVPSVKAAWYADVRLAGTVSRSVFWPVPNVDSGLVSLVRRPAAGDHRIARGGLRAASTQPSPSAARRCARRSRAGQGPRRGPRRCCAPPASTPARAASSSTSGPSPRSRQPRGCPRVLA